MPNAPANLATSPKMQQASSSSCSTLCNQTESAAAVSDYSIIEAAAENVKGHEGRHPHHPNEFLSTAAISKTDCPYERYASNTNLAMASTQQPHISSLEDFETPPSTPNFKTANNTCSSMPSQQQRPKAKETATSRFLDEHHPQLTRSNSTLSNASSMYSTQDLFSSISSVDLSGLASQTSNLLESMFGYPTATTPTSGGSSSGSVSGMTSNVLLGNGGSSRYVLIGAADNFRKKFKTSTKSPGVFFQSENCIFGSFKLFFWCKN